MHNLKGIDYEFYSSHASQTISYDNNFMKNMTGYPWVIEEISSSEIIYYLDDSKTLGFTVYDSGSYTTSGIFVTRNGVRAKNQVMFAHDYGSGIKQMLHFHVSENEDVVFLGWSYFGTEPYSHGIIAAKGADGNWAMLYSAGTSSNSFIYTQQTDIEKMDRACRLGVTGYNNYGQQLNPDSFFSIVKCPNVFSGKEFNSLYLVIQSPIVLQLDEKAGLGKVFVEVNGKTLRLVGLSGKYPNFGFPVSD